MQKLFKNRIFVTASVLVLFVVFDFGFYFGKQNKTASDGVVSIINKEPKNGEIDFTEFWKVWNIVNEKYVPTNSTTTDRVSDQTRVYGAIQGMVASLGDPYTVYFPPAETKSFNDQIRGSLEGVGMEVGIKDGVLTVIAPIKGTPAYRAGVKAGDKIVKIDEKVSNGLSTEEAVVLIRGPKGTPVKLSLVRAGVKDSFVLTLVRDVINIPTIDTEIHDDVFVIKLYNFSSISANAFRGALRDFVNSGKHKLVLDLRGNPGGYLDAAIDMASWFLPAGKTVVKEDFRNAQDAQVFRSKGYNVFNDTLKMVVLIDGGSASASEILAGALHDNGVATLVGAQSFGKGSVQEVVDLDGGTSVKVTIAKWLTPNGISISHQGLTPDVVVKLDDKAFVKDGTDTQMNKAFEILK